MKGSTITLTLPWHFSLSPCEKRVVDLYLEGWGAKDIAHQCGISVKTVGVHLFSIRNKMRKHNLRFARYVTDKPLTATPVTK
jgi:DNA-binding NarL/FixJ family response regulator